MPLNNIAYSSDDVYYIIGSGGSVVYCHYHANDGSYVGASTVTCPPTLALDGRIVQYG